MVVLTRKQLEKRSKEELIDELLTQFMKTRFDEFLEKYARAESELEISKSCMKLLSKQIEALQRNALDSSQYLRKKIIEINLVPEDIQEMKLEESICKAFSLTGIPLPLVILKRVT